MYKNSNGSWRIQCMPVEEYSFKSEWCGLRDQELSDLANIKDCIFCHANGFIGGNKTYEGMQQ